MDYRDQWKKTLSHLFSYNFVRFGRFACFCRLVLFVSAVSFRCFTVLVHALLVYVLCRISNGLLHSSVVISFSVIVSGPQDLSSLKERIMYLVRSLDRYIGRHLKEYRSILDRIEVDISVEYRLMYRPIVHLMILIVSFKISTAILSVVHLSTISYISVDCWSGLGRYSADILVDTRQSIGRYAIEYRSRIRSSGDRCIDR